MTIRTLPAGRRGFSLIELIVAVVIIILILQAIF